MAKHAQAAEENGDAQTRQRLVLSFGIAAVVGAIFILALYY